MTERHSEKVAERMGRPRMGLGEVTVRE
jgi:hypothetical protein